MNLTFDQILSTADRNDPHLDVTRYTADWRTVLKPFCKQVAILIGDEPRISYEVVNPKRLDVTNMGFDCESDAKKWLSEEQSHGRFQSHIIHPWEHYLHYHSSADTDFRVLQFVRKNWLEPDNRLVHFRYAVQLQCHKREAELFGDGKILGYWPMESIRYEVGDYSRAILIGALKQQGVSIPDYNNYYVAARAKLFR